MNCKQVREHSESFLDRQLGAPLLQQVERHLAECPLCAQEIAERRSFHQFIRKAAVATARTPSAEFRQRILLQLAAAPAASAQPAGTPETAHPTGNVVPLPSSNRRTRRAFSLMAVAAGFMLALAGFWAVQLRECPLVRAARHEYDAVMAGNRPLDKVSDNPQELARFVSANLNGRVPNIPDLLDCHLKPVGGGVMSEASGRQGVYVKYVECQCGHQPATLLVMDTRKTPRGEAVSLNEKTCWWAQHEDQNVVSWKSDDGLLYMLVTEAPYDQTMELALVASR